MHLTYILPLKFKRADYCPFDQFNEITLYFLLQFYTRHSQQWVTSEIFQIWAKGLVHGISNLGVLKKGHIKFPGSN